MSDRSGRFGLSFKPRRYQRPVGLSRTDEFELSVRRGGMKADDAKRRLEQLETENAQLERLVADKELENVALREMFSEER